MSPDGLFARGLLALRCNRRFRIERAPRQIAQLGIDRLVAIRELRVHNMRSEPPPAKSSGVLAKFFGR